VNITVESKWNTLTPDTWVAMIYSPTFPQTTVQYCGEHGRLPKLRQAVTVHNAYNDKERTGIVTQLFPERREYEVAILENRT
jgi:hypothetical protein